MANVPQTVAELRAQGTAALWPCAYDAAVFDFDGTIASTGSLWEQVDRDFLSRRGLEWTPDYGAELAARGFAGGAVYTIERYGLDETPEDVCAEWTELSAELYAASVCLRPGVLPYVEGLRSSGVKVALATTNKHDVLTSLKPRVDVDALFDTCVYGDEVARDKNHPDIYVEAAARLGCAPERMVVFEDIVPALHAARAAGMVACGVHSGESSQDEAAIADAADFVLHDWRDLPL